jgi:hypothetical protein
MNLKSFLKSTFGKDLFAHLKSNEILEERIKVEKKVERISDDMKGIQDKIQHLMIASKGQPRPLKLLNVQKIKALRLETATKQAEANSLLKQLQLLLLVEAMHEHKKDKEKSAFVEKILHADIDHLTDMLFDTDIKKAVQEGRIDDVKDKLKRTFAKGDMDTDSETEELMAAIDDLEGVDEETALSLAQQKAKEVSEKPIHKRTLETE